MLIERGGEGQIMSRKVRKQWREGEGVACLQRGREGQIVSRESTKSDKEREKV
jgi:hypothetical protein